MAGRDDGGNDIYDDLPDFRYDETLYELNAKIEQLLTEKNQLSNELSKMGKEKKELESTCSILKANVSSLLLTAKLEIRRKDRTIEDLRKKLNDALAQAKRQLGVRRGDISPEKVIRNKLMRKDRDSKPVRQHVPPVEETPVQREPDVTQNFENCRVELLPQVSAHDFPPPVIFNPNVPPPPIPNAPFCRPSDVADNVPSPPPPISKAPFCRPSDVKDNVRSPPACMTVYSARLYKKIFGTVPVTPPVSAQFTQEAPSKRETQGRLPSAADSPNSNHILETTPEKQPEMLDKPFDPASTDRSPSLSEVPVNPLSEAPPIEQSDIQKLESAGSTQQGLLKVCEDSVPSSKNIDESIARLNSFQPEVDSKLRDSSKSSAISDASANRTNRAINSVSVSPKLHPVASNAAVNFQAESVVKPSVPLIVRGIGGKKSNELSCGAPPKVVLVEEKENLDSATKTLVQPYEHLVCNDGPSNVIQNGQDLPAGQLQPWTGTRIKNYSSVPNLLKVKLTHKRTIAPISGWIGADKVPPDGNNDAGSVIPQCEDPTVSDTLSIKTATYSKDVLKPQNVVEIMFGSPLKWAEDSSSNGPQDEPAQGTKNDSMLSLFGSPVKSNECSNKHTHFILPPTAYEDSCMTTAGVDKGSRSPNKASTSESNSDEKSRPGAAKHDHPPPSVPDEKVASIFSPIKNGTKCSTVTEDLSRSHTGLYFPFKGSGFDDSVLGHFDDTAQFVSALANVNTKLSPLSTPVKPEISPPLRVRNNPTSFSEVFQRQSSEESGAAIALSGAASTSTPVSVSCNDYSTLHPQEESTKAESAENNDVTCANLPGPKDISVPVVAVENAFPPPKFPNGPVNVLQPRKTPRTTTSKYSMSPQPVEPTLRRVAISEKLVTRVTERVKEWEEHHLFENTLKSLSSSPGKLKSAKISPKSSGKKNSPKKSPLSPRLLGRQPLVDIAAMCKPLDTIEIDSTTKALSMIQKIAQKPSPAARISNVATEPSRSKKPADEQLSSKKSLGNIEINVAPVPSKLEQNEDVQSGAPASFSGVQLESHSPSNEKTAGTKISNLKLSLRLPKPVMKNQNFKRSSALRHATSESPCNEQKSSPKRTLTPQVPVKPVVITGRRSANFGSIPSVPGVGLSKSEQIVHSSVPDVRPRDEKCSVEETKWVAFPIDFRNRDIYQDLPHHAQPCDPRRRLASNTKHSQVVVTERENECKKADQTALLTSSKLVKPMVEAGITVRTTGMNSKKNRLDQSRDVVQNPGSSRRVSQGASSLNSANDINIQTGKSPRKTILLDVPIGPQTLGQKRRASPVDNRKNISKRHLSSKKSEAESSVKPCSISPDDQTCGNRRLKSRETEAGSSAKPATRRVANVDNRRSGRSRILCGDKGKDKSSSKRSNKRRASSPDDQKSGSRRHSRDDEVEDKSSAMPSRKRRTDASRATTNQAKNPSPQQKATYSSGAGNTSGSFTMSWVSPVQRSDFPRQESNFRGRAPRLRVVTPPSSQSGTNAAEAGQSTTTKATSVRSLSNNVPHQNSPVIRANRTINFGSTTSAALIVARESRPTNFGASSSVKVKNFEHK